MTRLAVILALLPGCSQTIPVYLTTSDSPAGPVTEPTPAVRDVLDEGFGWWGLEYDLVDRDAVLKSYGAIDLAVLELDASRAAGSAFQPAPCRPSVWVGFDGMHLAHELGHVWGLDHVEDPANLMNPWIASDDVDITTEQELDAEDAIGWFLACADGA